MNLQEVQSVNDDGSRPPLTMRCCMCRRKLILGTDDCWYDSDGPKYQSYMCKTCVSEYKNKE